MIIDPTEHWSWFAQKAAYDLGASLDSEGGLPLTAFLDLDNESILRAGRILQALFCPDSFMAFLHE